MSVSMLDNISYKGQLPDNVRSQFATIAEMVAYNENYLPDIYVTLCVETGKQYMFKRDNEVDAELGKWRVLECEVKRSEEDGNIIEIKEDGIFASIDVSATDKNQIEKKEDGLFVAPLKVSREEGNTIIEKEDGIYSPVCDVKVSEETGNQVELKDDGLFVGPCTTKISKDTGNIIVEKEDGIFAPAYELKISDEANNQIEEKTDGLYVGQCKISEEAGNTIIRKDDGLYSPVCDVQISRDTDNQVELRDDGLYVEKCKISKETGNTIVRKDDGLYSPVCDVQISDETGNQVELKTDGLYVGPCTTLVSGETGNTIESKDDGIFAAQPDWKVAEEDQPGYIKNKPELPSPASDEDVDPTNPSESHVIASPKQIEGMIRGTYPQAKPTDLDPENPANKHVIATPLQFKSFIQSLDQHHAEATGSDMDISGPSDKYLVMKPTQIKTMIEALDKDHTDATDTDMSPENPSDKHVIASPAQIKTMIEAVAPADEQATDADMTYNNAANKYLDVKPSQIDTMIKSGLENLKGNLQTDDEDMSYDNPGADWGTVKPTKLKEMMDDGITAHLTDLEAPDEQMSYENPGEEFLTVQPVQIKSMIDEGLSTKQDTLTLGKYMKFEDDGKLNADWSKFPTATINDLDPDAPSSDPVLMSAMQVRDFVNKIIPQADDDDMIYTDPSDTYLCMTPVQVRDMLDGGLSYKQDVLTEGANISITKDEEDNTIISAIVPTGKSIVSGDEDHLTVTSDDESTTITPVIGDLMSEDEGLAETSNVKSYVESAISNIPLDSYYFKREEDGTLSAHTVRLEDAQGEGSIGVAESQNTREFIDGAIEAAVNDLNIRKQNSLREGACISLDNESDYTTISVKVDELPLPAVDETYVSYDENQKLSAHLVNIEDVHTGGGSTPAEMTGIPMHEEEPMGEEIHLTSTDIIITSESGYQQLRGWRADNGDMYYFDDGSTIEVGDNLTIFEDWGGTNWDTFNVTSYTPGESDGPHGLVDSVNLKTYIDGELAKKQGTMIAGTNVTFNEESDGTHIDVDIPAITPAVDNDYVTFNDENALTANIIKLEDVSGRATKITGNHKDRSGNIGPDEVAVFVGTIETSEGELDEWNYDGTAYYFAHGVIIEPGASLHILNDEGEDEGNTFVVKSVDEVVYETKGLADVSNLKSYIHSYVDKAIKDALDQFKASLLSDNVRY
ncbi:MAG: hypothetical protein MJZ34_02340 [Paludibacteraceae bacterium]|nr:hypothetical protein [Paludibacteraceae bacterium]